MAKIVKEKEWGGRERRERARPRGDGSFRYLPVEGLGHPTGLTLASAWNVQRVSTEQAPHPPQLRMQQPVGSWAHVHCNIRIQLVPVTEGSVRHGPLAVAEGDGRGDYTLVGGLGCCSTIAGSDTCTHPGPACPLAVRWECPQACSLL